ncbi:MAG: glycosyltransferase family 4 protein [Pseudomonadota bacterium]
MIARSKPNVEPLAMRILWVSHLVPYPPKAGVLIRSYNLIRQLAKRAEVDLIMLNQPRLLGSYFDSQEAGKAAALEALKPMVGRHAILDIPAEQNPASRVLLKISSVFSRRGYTMRWLEGSSIENIVRAWTEQTQYDLVHLDTVSLDYLRRTLPPSTPIALDHHNIESHMMGRRASKEMNPLKRAYFGLEYQRLRAAEVAAIGEYSGNIVCSEDDKTRLLELNPSANVRVIPNGIDISGAPPERTPARAKLLFIGGLTWYPNLAAVKDLVDRVAPALRQRGVSFHIDIIGKGPTDEIKANVDATDDITLHGFVDDISQYYEQATAFVCPINDGGGTKLKILDAMAKRLPVVGYPLSCEGIEVKHNESALIAEGPDALASEIERLISDPRLRDRIGEQGRRLVEDSYDFDEIGRNLYDYYLGLLTDRPSP